MSQSSVILALQMWIPEPQGHSGMRRIPVRSGSHQSAVIPYSENWGTQDVNSDRYWPHIAEMPKEGMISVSSDSCIFLYIKKYSIP